jgi:GNAT superfamily N-acetyltransferase
VTPEELLSRFADSIGRPAEARLYLELFRSETPESFAIIAPGDRSRPAIDALLADLRYLVALGLYPVIWGASGELAQRAGDAGLPIAVATSAAEGAAAARAGQVPWAAGEPSVAAWAQQLASRKLVLLDGAIRRAGGEAISIIDVTADVDELLRPGALETGHARRLEEAARLQMAMVGDGTVALTSSFELLRELFTVRGAGTLVRRGVSIERRDGCDAGLVAALTLLFESAFGRAVDPRLFDRPALRIYLAGGEREPSGAAIVEAGVPAPYLSKFAVGPEARGAGIGRDLWRAITAEHTRFSWRARAANPITGWYIQQADGLFRAGAWNVFWCGLAPEEIPAAIDAALARPEDFAAPPGA